MRACALVNAPHYTRRGKSTNSELEISRVVTAAFLWEIGRCVRGFCFCSCQLDLRERERKKIVTWENDIGINRVVASYIVIYIAFIVWFLFIV